MGGTRLATTIRNMVLVFVDCEAFGPCPVIGRLSEFGAVEFKSQTSFHGKLFKGEDRFVNPLEWLSDDEIKTIFLDFEQWLQQFEGRPIFVSDNPAYDFQWINYEFHRLLGRNPFGHSARRISDFYAGLMGDFRQTQGWKRFRVTPHDHNPVHDALGNLEAFKKMLKLHTVSIGKL